VRLVVANVLGHCPQESLYVDLEAGFHSLDLAEGVDEIVGGCFRLGDGLD
jgi:hypothetical protein